MKSIVRINLNSREDYQNNYNEKILSYNLSNYILEELKGINPKEKIEFVITSKFKLNEKEKDEIVDMIRKNFGADIGEIINLVEKQRVINYSILVLGVLFIVVHPFLKNALLSEFNLILGWVFLGEAICNIFYKEVENRHKINRRKQIINAKILFEDNI